MFYDLTTGRNGRRRKCRTYLSSQKIYGTQVESVKKEKEKPQRIRYKAQHTWNAWKMYVRATYFAHKLADAKKGKWFEYERVRAHTLQTKEPNGRTHFQRTLFAAAKAKRKIWNWNVCSRSVWWFIWFICCDVEWFSFFLAKAMPLILWFFSLLFTKIRRHC